MRKLGRLAALSMASLVTLSAGASTATATPAVCEIAATSRSVRCRLDELSIGAEGMASTLPADVAAARALLDRVDDERDAEAARPALRALRARLRAIARSLRSRAARRTIDADARADLLATLDGLVADVKTMLASS